MTAALTQPTLTPWQRHRNAQLFSDHYLDHILPGRASTPEELLREAILTRDCSLWGGSRHLILPEWEGGLDQQELIDLTAFLASPR